jgi:3-deoxy-D-manno-octulosonic-acid transferase
LAPRHLNRLSEVENAVTAAGLSPVRKSAVNGVPSHPVIVLDTLGELGGLFALADAAFVGGTLADFGGHNLLEPLAWNVPVCFGPYTAAQQDSARLLLSHGAGARVRTPDELAEFVRRALTDPAVRESLARGMASVAAASQGRLEANAALI